MTNRIDCLLTNNKYSQQQPGDRYAETWFIAQITTKSRMSASTLYCNIDESRRGQEVPQAAITARRLEARVSLVTVVLVDD